jgi:hypothetical protein
MATKSFVRTRAGQRVDQPDFERASDTSPRDVVEQLGEHILTGSDTNRHYVLQGFTTTAVGTVVTVLGGVGLFGYRDRGEIRYGSIMSSGATSRSIDVGSFTDGAYTVYVALTLNDAEFGNRAFWDAALGTPAEVTRNVPTRRAENWAIAVETASPGAEWLPVATFTKTGASLSTPADIRELFFEGRANNSPAYSVTDAEWGSANDRNANRSTYGIRSLRKFVRAVQRQLNSIIGGANGWWDAVPAGANLTTLLSSKLARDGSQTMQGNLTPDGDNTRNLGAAGTRWANIFSALGYFNTVTAVGRFIASADNAALNGGGRARMLDGVTTGTTPNAEYRTIYQNESSALTSGPTLEIAVNALWSLDLSLGAYRWSSSDTSAESFLYSFGRSGFRIYRRAPTASVWLDSVGGTGWTLLYRIDENVVDLSAAPFVATGLLTPTEVTLATNAPATPAANTAYANMLVAARGTATSNGAGAISAGGSLAGGANFVPTLTGGYARITFSTAFSASDSYQIAITALEDDTCFRIVARTATYFDVRAFTSSSGATIDLSTNGRSFDFVVIGG